MQHACNIQPHMRHFMHHCSCDIYQQQSTKHHAPSHMHTF